MEKKEKRKPRTLREMAAPKHGKPLFQVPLEEALKNIRENKRRLGLS